MKMQEAVDIINGKYERKGYAVTFERIEGCILASDFFPDLHAGEPGIETESEAWRLAEEFAKEDARQGR